MKKRVHFIEAGKVADEAIFASHWTLAELRKISGLKDSLVPNHSRSHWAVLVRAGAIQEGLFVP